MTTFTLMASSARSFPLRLAAAAAFVLLCATGSRAGGPKHVAGTTYFDPSVTGQPLIWPQGQITYFTDQGDLSPILPNSSANAFVANAFSQWTSVSTAALVATRGGQLAEDVNGSNVTRNLDGSINMPADIQPTATGTPIGIVYDYDGSVTDAFLGSGAGDSSQCFSNAVFGGADHFGSFATIQHALVVIDGQCALQNSQLTDVEYRLVRVLGGVLGLGWSQMNVNVDTGKPPPTQDDLAGFPVMHYMDPWSCAPITRCYANPYQLAPDDIAAISRLYPVTAQNLSSFPGKQLFSSTTARIHGSVWFTNASGAATEPMQGVNVVARWIDPGTGQPSHRYAVSSVSGFLFTGNAGNPMTGFTDALGNPFSNWGSIQTSVQGFFDLAGLPFPNGAPSGQYQLTVEGLDPMWSAGVGPYAPSQVSPSGSAAAMIVNVAPGMDIDQDILMLGSAQPVPLWAKSATWSNPAPIPASGDWISSLSGYGDVPYFWLAARANRTLSVAVTALNEAGSPTITKAEPVMGMWSAGDPAGTAPPTFTNSPFNGPGSGMTRLDTQVLASANFLLGIADLRGDGRPDYRYHAHVLYADSVSPARLPVSGGAVTIRGIGFAVGQTVSLGTSTFKPLALNAGQIITTLPPEPDGLQNITINDPASGGSSTMTSVVTYGAAPTDNIVLVSKTNPQTPAGTQAANPVSVQVLASDGTTPVPGATVAWSATSGAILSACNGAGTCSALTDAVGMAFTWITPIAAGVVNITATLAPRSYSPAKSVTTTLSATSSALDIGILTPNLFVAQGASVSVPLTARVVSNGVAQSGATVNFQIMKGSGSLSASHAVTNASGYAASSLSLANFTVNVQVSACVAPANAPCQNFYLYAVPPSQQNLLPVAGLGQIITTGNAFQPVTVRVVDTSNPPNPIMAAAVAFQSTVLRPGSDQAAGGSGETNTANPGMPVILSQSAALVPTDANGLASIFPSTGSFTGSLEVDVVVSAGNASALEFILEAVSTSAANNGSQSLSSPIRLPSSRPLAIESARGQPYFEQ